jgi:drug/metabolite transporter (DMT)-like permease
VTVLVGAVTITFSGIFFRLSHVSPSTGAFFRCFWALPALWVLARWEERRWGRRPLRVRVYAWDAGLFFTADLILWHRSIDQVGAGLATVLANTQVVLVGLLAWLFLRERPTRGSLAAIPVVIAGVLLVSGVVESGAYGPNPGLGTVYGVCAGLAYTGFLLVLREGQRGIVGPAGPLFDATLAGAAGCAVVGAAIGDLDLTPSLAATGWLVLIALSAQVLGWLLISISLPRLPAVVTSVSLTVQPVCSVLLAALILGESPSWLQLVGSAAIVAGLVLSTLGRRQAVALPKPAAP